MTPEAVLRIMPSAYIIRMLDRLIGAGRRTDKSRPLALEDCIPGFLFAPFSRAIRIGTIMETVWGSKLGAEGPWRRRRAFQE